MRRSKALPLIIFIRYLNGIENTHTGLSDFKIIMWNNGLIYMYISHVVLNPAFAFKALAFSHIILADKWFHAICTSVHNDLHTPICIMSCEEEFWIGCYFRQKCMHMCVCKKYKAFLYFMLNPVFCYSMKVLINNK